MPSKWLDWPEIVDKVPDTEAPKPTELGFVGFDGSSPVDLSIIRIRESQVGTPSSDPYAERMRAVIDQINVPDYPAGMVPWLGTEQPGLYAELTAHLPDEIHRLWSDHAPLERFETLLAQLVALHKCCCELHSNALRQGTWQSGGKGPDPMRPEAGREP